MKKRVKLEDGMDVDEDEEDEDEEEEDAEMEQELSSEAGEPQTPKPKRKGKASKKTKKKKHRKSELNMEALTNEQAALAALESNQMLHLRLRKKYYAEGLNFIRQVEGAMYVFIVILLLIIHNFLLILLSSFSWIFVC
jgi:condensin complex subunit 1